MYTVLRFLFMNMHVLLKPVVLVQPDSLDAVTMLQPPFIVWRITFILVSRKMSGRDVQNVYKLEINQGN